MIKPQHKNERLHINAIEINAFFASTFSIKYFLTNWKVSFLRIILKLLLLFILFPILLALYLLQTIFLGICLLINFIPLVRVFFEVFYVIVYDIVALVAMFVNIYNSEDYTNKLNEYDKKHVI